MPGRVVLDGMYALQKDFSARIALTSFSLNSAADYYVKDALGAFATKVRVLAAANPPRNRSSGSGRRNDATPLASLARRTTCPTRKCAPPSGSAGDGPFS